MAYIKRDKQGKIEALYPSKTKDAHEKVDYNSAEFTEFLSADGGSNYNFLLSDLQLIRVLEDLIDILIEKNIITITDFPSTVIDKLLERHRVRQHLMSKGSMEFYNEDDDII